MVQDAELRGELYNQSKDDIYSMERGGGWGVE